jgi:hypothetical protein
VAHKLVQIKEALVVVIQTAQEIQLEVRQLAEGQLQAVLPLEVEQILEVDLVLELVARPVAAQQAVVPLLLEAARVATTILVESTLQILMTIGGDSESISF